MCQKTAKRRLNGPGGWTDQRAQASGAARQIGDWVSLSLQDRSYNGRERARSPVDRHDERFTHRPVHWTRIGLIGVGYEAACAPSRQTHGQTFVGSCETTDADHGRIERRRAYVVPDARHDLRGGSRPQPKDHPPEYLATLRKLALNVLRTGPVSRSGASQNGPDGQTTSPARSLVKCDSPVPNWLRH